MDHFHTEHAGEKKNLYPAFRNTKQRSLSTRRERCSVVTSNTLGETGVYLSERPPNLLNQIDHKDTNNTGQI